MDRKMEDKKGLDEFNQKLHYLMVDGLVELIKWMSQVHNEYIILVLFIRFTNIIPIYTERLLKDSPGGYYFVMKINTRVSEDRPLWTLAISENLRRS